MAPPPQQVRIKRKKDEEPVESLCGLPARVVVSCSGTDRFIFDITDVQTEQAHKRRRFTDFIFRRVRDKEPPPEESNGGQLSLSNGSNGRRKILRAVSTQPRSEVPTVQTTLPGDELRDGVHGFGRVSRGQKGRSGTPHNGNIVKSTNFKGLSNDPSTATTATAGRPSPFNPRRFHLIKSTSTPFPQGPIGIQKRKKGVKSDIAVFVEREARLQKSKSLLHLLAVTAHDQEVESSVEPSGRKPGSPEEITTPRRRPNASATERQWRADNWSRAKAVGPFANPSSRTGTSIETQSSLWDYDSTQLVEQLQEIARQESSKYTTPETSPKRGATNKLKSRPKVPALRYAARHPEDSPISDTAATMDLSSDVGDDSDYVYDTYIRQPGEPIIVDNDVNMETAEPEDFLQGKVGLLVITEEDQERWEAFAEDDDSEKDWNSEEEDENGTQVH